MVQHASPVQQTGQDSQHKEARPDRSIVVGLDTRGRSVSALVWAVEEAERDGTALTLISARPESASAPDPGGEHDLGALARRLTSADLQRREVESDPVEALLDAAPETDLIVVGCRSGRPTQRTLMGSTSRSVARWSPVPVVVVPETWMQPSVASAPVVVGVRPQPRDTQPVEESDHEVLDFAFARAGALEVPLAVVSAWEIPTVSAWSPEDIERLRDEHDDSLERRLGPWRARYPHTEVSVHSVAERPDQALLDASRVAQLIVVGRHHSGTLSGRLGSTASGVLRHAARPVAVVPAGTRDELLRQLDIHRSSAERPWGPML